MQECQHKGKCPAENCGDCECFKCKEECSWEVQFCKKFNYSFDEEDTIDE